MSANLAVNDGFNSGIALTVGPWSGASSIYGDGSSNCYIPYPSIVNPRTYNYWLYPPFTLPTPEKPEDTIARASRELAAAATQLQRSADALGLDLDRDAIRKAVYKKIANALGD